MLRMLGAVAAAVMLTSPAHAAETIATLPNESWIRSLGDLHLIQVRTERGYELNLIEDGRLGELDAIGASRYPMDADLGTERHGEPAVVYSRCADAERRRCDLWRYSIAAAEPVKLRGANTRASETAPTLWLGRLAWVRGRRAVLTRRLGSRGRSRKLYTAPRGSYSEIEELELGDRHLGIDVVYPLPGGDMEAARRVRLLDLRSGRSRTLDSADSGSTGHRLRGLSFVGDWFGWHDSFWEGEFRGRAHRFNVRTGATQVAGIGNFGGFALAPRGFVGVTHGSRIEDAECDTPCEVVRERRIDWRRERVARAARERASIVTTLPIQSSLKAHGGYRLVQMRRRGRHTLGLARLQGTEPLPITTSGHPIEGDIGAARRGQLPLIVYSRCRDARRRRCSLWLYHRLRDTEPRPLGLSGTAPTVWRDRIAWVRDGAVRTRRIGSRRSRLLVHAVPGVTVEELELHGDHLAMSLRKRRGRGTVIEVRLDGRSIASTPAGEGGQRYGGLSFAAGRLGWNLSCPSAPSCGTVHRYRLQTGVLERAESRNLSGFALTHYGYLGVDPRGDVSPARTCRRPCLLTEVRGVRWRR